MPLRPWEVLQWKQLKKTKNIKEAKMSLVFFHPTKNNKGSMASFDLQRARNGEEGRIWANIAKQNEEGSGKKFNFKNRKIIKLGLVDIIKIVYGIKTKAKEITLIHSFQDTKTVITWKRCLDEERHFAGYYFNIAGHSIRFTPEELYGICKMFDTAIPQIVSWEREERSSVFEDIDRAQEKEPKEDKDKEVSIEDEDGEEWPD